ncbi:terminase large subunit [Marinobacter sp. NSM]|uniref:terminase large subunit n=1 Tax=Marinobacter sp. NSM TaxID=3458004 RepID=UPI004036F16D
MARKPTRGQRVIAFIEQYCRVPEGKLIGQPIKLAPFQKRFLLDVYDNKAGTSIAYLSIARKNGKTGLIAGILLAHLVGPEAKQNSQIVSGAMSREQAGIVFALACKMIQLNPKLSEIVHIIPSGKRLIGKPMNVEYKALAAEGKTTHGLSPVLAILDEIGQVRGPQSEFVDAITTAQGAHEDPLLIAISTQAATDNDLFSIWLDDAERSKDPHIVSHLYQAPKDAKLTDRKAWKAANPALGLFRSLPDLEKQAERAERMPSSESTFRNLCLNQRVSTVSPFVSKGVWESCGGEPSPLQGLQVYGGLDLSARTDLTSLVLAGADEDGVKHVLPFFWVPEQGIYDRAKRDRVPYDVWAREGWLRTTPGATVDYAFVAADMADIMADLDVQVIGFDRWRMDVFKKELERLGLDFPMSEFGQGFKDMSPALDALEADLLNARIRHGMHPVLTMCAANAVVTKDPANNRKLDKHKATGRIDGMVALAMALGVGAGHEVDRLDIDSFLSDPLVL